jgi:hypothetical protein
MALRLRARHRADRADSGGSVFAHRGQRRLVTRSSTTPPAEQVEFMAGRIIILAGRLRYGRRK